ncbi:MAG: cell cycle transcriptional regulator TrcR [Alphaproteobacteria bacterium]
MVKKKLIHPPILMPRATAVWLIDNTSLAFQQIADFCGLHLLEVENLADADNSQLKGMSPILNGQLSKDEITRCEKDEKISLKLSKVETHDHLIEERKGARYTPIAKRGNKPDAILWLLKNHSGLSDSQIGRLIGTTLNTIKAIKHRTHWNMANLSAKHPVELGLCTKLELEKLVNKIKKVEQVDDDNLPDGADDKL